jgi:hypothetical protein
MSVASPSLAQGAPDFVFNVPVRIENTPPLAGQRASITCQVRAISASGAWLGSRSGISYIDIGASGYSGTVRVEVILPPEVPRASVREWSCGLRPLNATSTSGAAAPIGGASADQIPERYTAITGQAIASHRLNVSGTISR